MWATHTKAHPGYHESLVNVMGNGWMRGCTLVNVQNALSEQAPCALYGKVPSV